MRHQMLSSLSTCCNKTFQLICFILIKLIQNSYDSLLRSQFVITHKINQMSQTQINLKKKLIESISNICVLLRTHTLQKYRNSVSPYSLKVFDKFDHGLFLFLGFCGVFHLANFYTVMKAF